MREIVFELSPDQKRVEHLIEFSNSLTDEPWHYNGDVVAVKGDGSITVHGVVSWDQHDGGCALGADGYFGHHLMHNGSYGKFIPDTEYVSLSGVDGSWSADKALVSGTHTDDGRETVTMRFYDFGTGELNKATSSMGLVLAGADMWTWPMGFPNRIGGVSIDGFVTTIFGRDALIRRMPTKTEAGYDMLVGFDGGPLEAMQQSALWIVMSFLAGRRANVVGSIGIEGSQEVWRRRHMWKAPLHKALPPLGPQRLHDLPTRFPQMLDRAYELLIEDIPIDVALEHFFADSRGHLDIEIRDISLALDALIEANAFKSNGVTVIKPDEYEDLMLSLNDALEAALKDHPNHDDLLSRIMDRVKTANDISHGERRNKFFARVGFGLKPDEKDALHNRHPMAHSGYLLRHAGNEQYEALMHQVRLARNFVNRVILALLGYEGTVFDYVTGRIQPWQYFIARDGSRKKKQ